MKQKAKEIIKHPLIYGSGIVVIGGMAANFFNFLFNLFMSRNLPVEDYGTLASIISLITFPSLIVSAVTPLIINFSGNYFAHGKLDMIRGLYLKISKFLLIIGILFFFSFLINISTISKFFHIENLSILIITDFMILLAFIGIVNVALLQAKLAFTFQVIINLLGSIVKLLVGATFIFLGYSVFGAVSAIFISGIVVYLTSFIPLRFLFNKKLIAKSVIDTKELFAYGIPSAITLFGLTSLISTDLILVKHYFDPNSAGIYAGMSLIGRVIFYISYPIGSVMFPLIVRKHSKNEDFGNTFKISLLMVFLPSVALTLFYSIFPKFSILFFLKKEEYLAAVPYVGLFGAFISLYCLLFIIANFYLSIKETKIYIPILIGAILQIVLISFYHQTYLEIIVISILITFLLVLGLLLYYPHATQKRL
ncbi:MAG TPA: oligosaccharide flippase family protein [Candidatus Limnocylindrales bacterium]|nr:oligosaccharide flippase family protein [Candidatus Limnocylindrales bacterium]